MDPTIIVINENKYILSRPTEKPFSDELIKSMDKTSESSNSILNEEANNNIGSRKAFTFSKRPKISEADMLEKESIVEKEEGSIKEEVGNIKEEEGVNEKEEGVNEKEEGIVEKEEGSIKEEVGNIKEEEGIVEKEEGIVEKEEGTIKEEVGNIKEEEGVNEKEEGIVEKEEGSIKEEIGNIKEEEGANEKEEGIVEKEEGNIKEEVGNIKEKEGIVEKNVGRSDRIHGNTLKYEGKNESSIGGQVVHVASIEKHVAISEKDKCENKLKNTFILNGDFSSGKFTLIVNEFKNGTNPNISKAIILGEKEDASGRYKATIFKNSGYEAGVEFKREGKIYVTEFATKEEEEEFLGIWNNYLTVMKNSSKEDSKEEKSPVEKGISNVKDTDSERPLQFKKISLDGPKEPPGKSDSNINDATLKNSIVRNTKIQKDELEKGEEVVVIKNKGFNYNMRKSEIQAYAIFCEKIQKLNLELNHSDIALNGHHEILMRHQPKKRRLG